MAEMRHSGVWIGPPMSEMVGRDADGNPITMTPDGAVGPMTKVADEGTVTLKLSDDDD